MRARRVRRRSWLSAVTCLALAVPASLGADAAAGAPAAAGASLGPARTAAATAPAPTTTGAWTPVAEDVVLAFVMAVYQDLFERAPDALGLATWARLLLQGTPYGEVAKAITNSDEYRSRLIRETYQHYLGRDAEPSGLAFWLQQMRAGRHIEEIQAGFIASDEYYLKHGATPSGWVTGLYQSVLGRTPAADEVRWWVDAMRAGLARRDVARGFLYSTEHLTTVVDGYYLILLDRHIDPSGQATWVRLIQEGHRDEEIIASVVSSAEYRAKNPPVAPPPVAFLVGPPGNTYGANWTLSNDGRWVVFETSSEELVGAGTFRSDVYLWDRTTGVRTRLSQAPDGSAPNGWSDHPTISADGRWVVFSSNASNLVSGDTNGSRDLFVWDRTTGELSLLGLTGPGTGRYYFEPSISADGRWITYVLGGNTAEVYLADRLDGTTREVSAAAGGYSVNGNADSPAISGDGRWVLFRTMKPRDDVVWPYDAKLFLWDRDSGTTTSVPEPDVVPFEISKEAVISADGRWISYAAVVSDAEPSRDVAVYVVDRTTGERTSVPPLGQWGVSQLRTPSLSADGRWVTFITGSNVGVLDRASGTTSLAPRGFPAYNGAFSQQPVISGDGQWILFESCIPDLVEGDTNEDVDLFVTRNPLAQP